MATKQLKTAEAVFDQIVEDAATSTDELRFVRVFPQGKKIRQGDIYVEAVKAPAVAPKGSQKGTSFQLAPGATKGSRHVAEGKGLLMVPSDGSDPLQGPLVASPERFTVTHPEHSDVSVPSGTYRVTYQRDYAQEERARVLD